MRARPFPVTATRRARLSSRFRTLDRSKTRPARISARARTRPPKSARFPTPVADPPLAPGGAHLPWFIAALCFAWATFMTFNVLTRDDGPRTTRSRSGLSLSTMASMASGDAADGVSAAVEAELARVRSDHRSGPGDPDTRRAYEAERTDRDRLRTRTQTETSGAVPRKAAAFGVEREARRSGAAKAARRPSRDTSADSSSDVSSSESAFLASAAPLPKSTYGYLDAISAFPGFPRTPPVLLSASGPKAYLFRNFLNTEECEHLKALAKKQLAPSTVVGTNGPVSSGIRTSAGTFLVKGQDAVVSAIEQRMALAAGLPEPNGEGMQILRYDEGQKYDPHYDYFHDSTNASPRRGGQRMATMLVYLADTEKGGETVFPKGTKPVDFDHPDAGATREWSDCANKGGIPVASKKGDAVLFWSLTGDYKLDPGSLHGACPVVKGEKWTAVKWMRVAKFDGGFKEDAKLPMPSLSVSRRDSEDEDERCLDEWAECADWARRGWCARNPEFMIGKKGARDSKGPACPQSCGVKCA